MTQHVRKLYTQWSSTPSVQHKVLAETGTSVVGVLVAMLAFFGIGIGLKKRRRGSTEDTNDTEE